MQPLNSAISGALGAVTQRSSVGGSPGTTGSTSLVIASESAVRDWLLRQPSPEAADAALARSLISTLGVTASPRTRHLFPSDGPAYSVVTGYGIEVVDPANIPAAIVKIEQALTPATTEQCETWLVMLQASTARRTDTEFGSAVAYTVYAAELRRWPADVAKAACERLARGRPGQTGTYWFPTLAELVSECERFAAPRKALHASLQRWAPEPTEPRQLEESDRAAIRRMADDAMAQLKATSESKRRIGATLPSIAGKVDETGITAEMRALLARQRGEA